jgi:glyoxylase-like metal-dependent hydrolase (beta-lactamase superfamily II)
VADPARRHPANAPGPWFVDTTCIDCDVSLQCAPWMFGVADGQAVVVRQPATPGELRDAARAMLACPTGSVGVQGDRPDVPLASLFPEELEPGSGVYYTGYNSRDSFGANAFFVKRATGNLLVDAPRWVPSLAERLGALGGLAHVLLTHQDDVADAERYASRFGARVWIHEADRRAAPFASDVLHGRDPTEIAPELLAIPVPGHTRGSVVYSLERRFLFTGDSLYWSREHARLGAFRAQTWYSWPELTRSLDRLRAYDFEWVLAGHGDRHRAPVAEMRAHLERLVAWMRTVR